MYEVKSISENGFYVTANSDNADYVMDKEKLNGTTPVGVVNVAISGCAIMCVRGYYLRKKINDVVIRANVKYDNMHFDFTIEIDRQVSKQEEVEIVEYIEKYCTVGQMLKESITKTFTIIGK